MKHVPKHSVLAAMIRPRPNHQDLCIRKKLQVVPSLDKEAFSPAFLL
jgi:hypothetical protein